MQVVCIQCGCSALTYDQADKFLRKYMPNRDTWLSEAFISNNIQAALSARNSSEWAATVPVDTFLDYVLPYSRQVSKPETAHGHCQVFSNKLLWHVLISLF